MEWSTVGKHRKPFAEGPVTAVLHGTSMPGCSWGKETSLSLKSLLCTEKSISDCPNRLFLEFCL